ncbi:MAG: universal stress protein [Solirubrobacterales bacterium]|nr:universal stress protein [Solirubrobacterales bacterium]
MRKVIVGYDSREEASDALSLGQALAKADAAELHVAVVLPRSHVPFEEAIAGGALSEQLDERLFGRAERTLGSGEFTRASLDGGLGGRSAARALYEYAEVQDADLIVVGSSHRGKLGRILPGSVAESLLRGAPCAVAVAPRGFAGREHAGFGVIGVAYDGSAEARLALAAGESLSQTLAAELKVITVAPMPSEFKAEFADAERLAAELRRQYRGILERGVAVLRDDTRAEAVLTQGDPGTVLGDLAADLDLLVVGSRGYGPVRSALLGAISTAVIRSAPCPVLVVPRGAGSTDGSGRGAESGVGEQVG